MIQTIKILAERSDTLSKNEKWKNVSDSFLPVKYIKKLSNVYDHKSANLDFLSGSKTKSQPRKYRGIQNV
jgi:hypothetical protein